LKTPKIGEGIPKGIPNSLKLLIWCGLGGYLFYIAVFSICDNLLSKLDSTAEGANDNFNSALCDELLSSINLATQQLTSQMNEQQETICTPNSNHTLNVADLNISIGNEIESEINTITGNPQPSMLQTPPSK
jgi:hypothetical protein